MANTRGNDTTPLVSVCCTTYNMEKIVSETIDSILAQKTSFPFELIIHDDASTDRTQEIINSYAQKYPGIIKTIFQKKNIYTSHEGGLGYMFNNFILPETRGEFIAISDGDDYWTDPEKLQKQIDHLNATSESVACFTNARIINEIDSNRSREYHNNQEEGFVPELSIALRAGGYYSASTLVFRKKSFMSSIYYKHFDEFAKYHEYDTTFIYCLMLAGKISYLSDVTAIYRQWIGGLYSSIMYDPEKTARIIEKEMMGTKKLIRLVDKEKKKLFRRKLSVDSLHMIRTRSVTEKFKYLKYLHVKEIIRLITGKN
ncbi:MAG: glycosyltransferase [Cyclonatronaceae bacterium]